MIKTLEQEARDLTRMGRLETMMNYAKTYLLICGVLFQPILLAFIWLFILFYNFHMC